MFVVVLAVVVVVFVVAVAVLAVAAAVVVAVVAVVVVVVNIDVFAVELRLFKDIFLSLIFDSGGRWHSLSKVAHCYINLKS